MILSVVTTVYNQAPYVAQMIESVLSQNVDFEYEFIIADDASTDNSADIIQKYADQFKHIVFLNNSKNLGPIRNYAQCLKRATGKFIADIGGDDYWIDPQKLTMQVEFLEDNEDVGMVYTQYDTITSKTGKIKKKAASSSKLLSGFLFDEIICFEVDINVCTSCFRRKLIAELIPKFEQGSYPYEDTPLWLTISKTHRIEFMPVSTLCYRINEESLSHSNNTIKRVNFLKDTENIRRSFIPLDFDKEKVIKFEDEINAHYFVVYLKEREKREFYYRQIICKGTILRVLNVLPFEFVLNLHQRYLSIRNYSNI